MRKVLLVVIACLFVVSLGAAAPGAVRCGKLLDVRAGRMLSDQIVVLDEAGSITAVGPAASTKTPAGGSLIDLSGATCLRVYPHGDNAKQFVKMVEWGMKPIDAIQAATINAADALGWSEKSRRA